MPSIDIEFLPHQERLFYNPSKIKGFYCGRGAGKSYYTITSSSLDLIQGLRVLYFCQTNAVMESNFLPEIKRTLEEWGFTPKVNEKKHTITLKESNGILFYYSYENYENARGATKIRKIYFDEVAMAPSPSLLFAAVAPCMRDSGGETEICFASTPKKGTEWDKWVMGSTPEKFVLTGVTMDDNPKATEQEKALIRALITDPNLYRQEINGEVLSDDIEFCVIREGEFPKLRQASRGFVSLGIDCAGLGRDFFEFVLTDDAGIIAKVETQQADTLHQFSIVRELVQKYDVKQIVIDITGGFGNGLFDLCKRAFPDVEVIGVNFGAAAMDSLNYANARAEMYFVGAEFVRSGGYVEDEKIKEEMTHTTYNITNGGKVLLVPKEKIKELIGRSPDSADAFCLSVYKRAQMQQHANAQQVGYDFLRAWGL